MGILSFFRRTKAAHERGLKERQAFSPSRAPVPGAPGTPVVQRDGARSGANPQGTGEGEPGRDSAANTTRSRVPFSAAVLLEPRVTEKATLAQGHGHYTFRVAETATKQDVRRAVEQQFGVHCTDVRMMNVRGKARRRGRIEGRTRGHKKALVALKTGERIDLVGAAT